MKDTRKASDFWIGLGVIAISIIFYLQADKMPAATRGIGPGDYPKVICYVLFALGLIQTVGTIIKCKGIPLVDFKAVNVRWLVRAFLMVLLTYLYYKFVKKIGFLLLTPVYLFASFLLFGYRRKIKGAVIAILFSVVIYFLFTKVFMVLLPRGILG